MVPLCPLTVMPDAKVVVPLPSRSMRLPAPVLPSTMLPLPDKVPSPSKLRMPLPLRLMAPLSTRPPALTRSRLLTIVAMSRLPFRVTFVRRLLDDEMTENSPLPLVLMMPLMVTPFCSTVLPTPATICPVAPPVTSLLSTKVPPLMARKVPLLTTDDSRMLMVPPATSALIRPLLTSVCVPPTLI